MASLLAITNAAAGTSEDASVDAALTVLRADFAVAVAGTSSPDDLQAALAEHPDVDGVVILGGDGSLHAVISALRAAERLDSVTVGLIPLGTGNDYAATLDLPTDPAAAARVICAGRIADLDLIIDGTDRVVVNAAHIGLGAEAAVAAAPWKKLLGPVGYTVGSALTGVRGLIKPGAHVRIEIDGEQFADRRVVQVAVGNGRFVGGGAPLLPDADPTDGLLDVAISYPASIPRRIGYVANLRSGRHTHRDDVIYRQATQVSVIGDAMPGTSDGELSDPRTEHAWRVEQAAMRMWR